MVTEVRNSRAYVESTKSKSNDVRLQLKAEEANAIVDSECDMNLIPASLVEDQMMRRTKLKMTAINQTPTVDI